MTYADYLLWVIGKVYKRPKFGKFLKLEDAKHRALEAAKRKEEDFPKLVTSYISAAFCIPTFILSHLRWDLEILLFYTAIKQFLPSKEIPLLKPNKQKDKKDAWDYEGRGYTMYLHILSGAYGWSKKEIDNLDVDEALALVQEVITDDQLDREFLWSMSDKSYIYNYQTKTGKANPLDRPFFMREEVKAPEKTKLLKSMMPVGNGTLARTEADLKPVLPNARGL